MPNIPSLVAPSSRTWFGIAREATTGTPVSPVATIPLEKSTYEPEDMPKFLEDLAIRGSMSHRFQDIIGVEDASWSLGGPVFGDVYGYLLDNIFGDLSTTGVSSGSASTTTGSLSAGATSAVLTSATGFTNTANVQIDTGSVSEVVTLSSAPSGGTITFATNPLRFAHGTGVTAQVVTGPFTHVFAVLNQSASVGGTNGAQPPTHTATDYTSLTTSVGARAYPSLALSALDFTLNSEQLFMAKATGISWPSAAAASTPTNSTTFVSPVAAWRTTLTIGTVSIYDVGDLTVNLKRELGVYWELQGTQSPFIVARGALDAAGAAKFTVPSDETALNYMLNNTQPAMSVAVSNNVSGTGTISYTFAMQYADFFKSKPVRSGVLVGYDNEYRTHANTTNVGGSAGLGQVTVTVINNVATY